MKRILPVLVLVATAAVLLFVYRPDRDADPNNDPDESVSGQQSSTVIEVTTPFTPVDTSKLLALPYPYDLENAFPGIGFGNQRPLQVLSAPGDNENLFVLCQEGLIHVFVNTVDVDETSPFLDLRDRVSRRGNEEGLLGLAFHPDYEANGELFVCYSAEDESRNPRSVISRFRRKDDALAVNPASEEVLLEIPQPFRTQNGGSMEFGPDGFLYIGLGDGGSSEDPQEHGQNLKTLHGSILRIDVDRQDGGRTYAIPPDNPFVDSGEEARGEIWAYGFRNVWRLAFDRMTGDLWCGDVGQDRFEEVNIVKRGGNYGWNEREGRFPLRVEFRIDQLPLTGTEIEAENARFTDPAAMYYHSEGRAVVGGRVYRGSRLEELQGAYLYADFFSGFIWALARNGEEFEDRWVCNSTAQIAGFGEDANGELYLCAFDGKIYRLAPNEQFWDGSEQRFPYRLSQTGLFESTEELKPVAGVRPYSVNVPLWSDHAHKERLIALPKDGGIRFSESGIWEFPVGTVVIKHFMMELTEGDPASRRRLETRLLVNGPRGWDGYTYLWNEAQTDAALIEMAITEQLEIQTARGPVYRNWYYPSRSDCKSCHTQAAGFVLSVNTRQLNRIHDGENQLRTWAQAGMFREQLADSIDDLESFPDWRHRESGATATLARAYLDVNCAFCHAPAGPGNAPIDLRYHTPLAQTVLVGVAPRGTRTSGPPATALITPNRPGDSELLRRMELRGPGQMPILATSIRDESAIRIVSDWIREMPANR